MVGIISVYFLLDTMGPVCPNRNIVPGSALLLDDPARKKCSLVCPPKETFPDLPIFETQSQRTVFPGMSK